MNSSISYKGHVVNAYTRERSDRLGQYRAYFTIRTETASTFEGPEVPLNEDFSDERKAIEAAIEAAKHLIDSGNAITETIVDDIDPATQT